MIALILTAGNTVEYDVALQDLEDDAAFDATFSCDADPLELEVELAFEALQEPVSDRSAVELLEFAPWEQQQRGVS